MAGDKIKVVGYAQKVQYTDGIEYRNFTPDLVGLQLASNGGTPLFTMGNFAITTNLDPKLDKFHNTSKFSNFVTLSELDLSLAEAQELFLNNAEVVLNLDKSNLDYYALFGSLNEFMRVSLEDIITTWPASLFLYPVSQTVTGQPISGYTFENYNYDSFTDTATFKINTTFVNNKFQINFIQSGTIENTFNSENSLRNFTVNYPSYVIFLNGIEYPVVSYTASTYETLDYAYLTVGGNPFSGVSQTISYHIKPKKLIEDKFFNGLPDFEAFLLNRNVSPIYSATFKYPVKSDTGLILYVSNTLTWPVTDGYNIDFDTTAYEDYAAQLSEIATTNDLVSSNLMGRFLVSESITSFDTSPVVLSELDQDTSGKKVNKLLQIYGAEFDKLNQFITGIEFANTVTYDKENNTPDVYLKNVAKVLGWELISSIVENDLLASYVTTSPSTFSGQSVGLTPIEADFELWRRIILNTPWIWKSKGARKSIEFLLNFIGVPKGLVNFNEHIYKASGPIDVDLFKQVLTLNGLNDDISLYPIDSDGYPAPKPNTPNMYFQNYGLWYRETGGSGSTIDILKGNNPHVGPYDGGSKYINQFRDLIPNFSAVTISSVTTTTSSENLYTNYDLGSFNAGVTTATTVDTVDAYNADGTDLDNCIVFIPSIQPDPMPQPEVNDCGCESAGNDKVLSLCLDERKARENRCTEVVSYSLDVDYGVIVFNYYQYNQNGTLFRDGLGKPILNTTNFTNQTCCKAVGGKPFLYDEVINGKVISSGYLCCGVGDKCGCTVACKWTASATPINLPIQNISYSGTQQPYLQFILPSGQMAVTTPDGCNCISPYTVKIPNVVDPYSGQKGYGCQLTKTGVEDLTLGATSVILTTYLKRAAGLIKCF